MARHTTYLLAALLCACVSAQTGNTIVATATTSTLPPAMNTTSPTNTPSDGCNDDARENCWSRPDENCFGIYESWSQVHCPLRCGFCPGKEAPCVDMIDNCDRYGEHSCSNETFQVWARTTCRKHCHLCAVPSRPLEIPGFYSSSPTNDDILYACAGDKVYIRWKYILAVDEELGDIQWYSNDQMVAVLSHTVFLTTPVGQSKGLEFLANAGILLNNVTVADSGNYSVEIHVYRHGQSFTVLRRYVQVRVYGDLPTVEHQLRVTLNPEAVFDPRADEWALQLQCGIFTFALSRPPPLEVEWVTPTGEVVKSSSFQNNRFNLLVRYPVQGGPYTCRVPTAYLDKACVVDTNVSQAALEVSQIEGRFVLLARENERLREELTNVTHALNSFQSFQQRVVALESKSRPIAFSAKGSAATLVTRGAPLLPSVVSFNYGQGYNATSGLFHAPVAGLYFLMASCAPLSVNLSAYSLCALYRDSEKIEQGGAVTLDTPPLLDGHKGVLGGSVQALLMLHGPHQAVSVRVEVTLTSHTSVTFSGFLVEAV